MHRQRLHRKTKDTIFLDLGLILYDSSWGATMYQALEFHGVDKSESDVLDYNVMKQELDALQVIKCAKAI